MENPEYPEKSEIVLGTVKEIFGQGAFITLDEYGNKKGMLHVSEISLKWVRNIRDYVREGQKAVFEVLDVKPDKGHIDLSLRRVKDAQRKNKLQEVKQKQRSNHLLGLVAKELEIDAEAFKEKISENLLEEYESVYAGLEAMTVDESLINNVDIEDEQKPILLDFIKKSINPPYVEISGFMELESTASNGVEIIKSTLNEMIKHVPKTSTVTVTYVSAPIYKIHVKAADYKEAEGTLKNCSDQDIKFIKSKKGMGEFHRELKKEHKK